MISGGPLPQCQQCHVLQWYKSKLFNNSFLINTQFVESVKNLKIMYIPIE